MKLNDFAVYDFTGGVRRDKSDLELQRNELKDAVNIEIIGKGRVYKRRGSVQFGDTATGTIGASASFALNTSGVNPTTNHIWFGRTDLSAVSGLYRIFGTRLTANVVTTDVTITVASTTNFDASGNIEIEGDLIAYTGLGGGGTTFTGVTGITSTHLSGAAIHQVDIVNTGNALDGRNGIYFAILNNLLFINGTNGSLTWNNSSAFSAVAGVSALFATNYKDRIYGAGDGSSGTNDSPIRVSYSDLGDSTSWTTTNFFDVEDSRGEAITGFKEDKENLFIYKPNSTFVYNLTSLSQTSFEVGAYNHQVVQEIDGFQYTFCPSGVYAGNGFSWQLISEPIREYVENFIPKYSTPFNRIVGNTFAGNFEGKYYLYIGNIISPEVRSDVVLVYDTRRKLWSVEDGYTNLSHFLSAKSLAYGTGTTNGIVNNVTYKEILLWGDTSGKFYRMFSTKHLNSGSTVVGNDVLINRLSDTGSAISSRIETPMYDIASPHIYKDFGYIQVFSQQGRWNVEYRTETRKGTTDYKSIGYADMTNNYLKLGTEGYRIGFRFSENGSANRAIFNGFIIGDIFTKNIK